MEDDASVIPVWDEPPDDGPKRGLMTWVLVLLAITVAALLVIRPPLPGGAPAVRQSVPSPGQTGQAQPMASDAPRPRPGQIPATTATPGPTAAAPPRGAMSPSTTTHVTGVFAASGTPKCNNSGLASATSPPICAWGVTAAAGSTVNYTLTWPENTPLKLAVVGAPPTTTRLAAGQGTGSVTLTVPNTPAQTLVVVGGATAPATFDLQITVSK